MSNDFVREVAGFLLGKAPFLVEGSQHRQGYANPQHCRRQDDAHQHQGLHA
ncbi:hypothetical protein N7568_20480 [Paenarthrobacter aurescens]|nr:hypothetical protein [Paenarthrobacter aurescens]